MLNCKVKIWGSRGSFVQTHIDKMEYGLETSCISFETETEIFVIDCGSGIRSFDAYYYKNNLKDKKINLLLTHYHQDHIFGLGFTKFIYDSNIEVEIYGLNDVYTILKNYYGPPYFPITIVNRPNLKTTTIEPNMSLKFKDIEIVTTLLNHPQDALGYKFVIKDKVCTVITDYEYKIDNNKVEVEKFIKDSDYLIIDAFFTTGDYREGWGHSSIEEAIELVDKLNVGYCLLYHHNLNYNDDKMKEIECKISKTYNNISFAKDNSFFEI